eukprot:9194950-Alexandrium_andersonii.AAC.1
MAIHVRYAKTGPNQGARLDWSGTIGMLLDRLAQRKSGQPLFDVSQRRYQAAWRSAVVRLQ